MTQKTLAFIRNLSLVDLLVDAVKLNISLLGKTLKFFRRGVRIEMVNSIMDDGYIVDHQFLVMIKRFGGWSTHKGFFNVSEKDDLVNKLRLPLSDYVISSESGEVIGRFIIPKWAKKDLIYKLKRIPS